MGKMIFSKFAQSNIVDQSNLYISNRTFEKIKNIYNDNIILKNDKILGIFIILFSLNINNYNIQIFIFCQLYILKS